MFKEENYFHLGKFFDISLECWQKSEEINKTLNDNKDYFEKEGVTKIEDFEGYFWKKERNLLPQDKKVIYYSNKLFFALNNIIIVV